MDQPRNVHVQLFERDTYAGDPSDTTVEYACLLLMSIGTLLSSERTLYANHRNAGTKKLTDAHCGFTNGSHDPLIDSVPSLVQQKYPVIVRHKGSQTYALAWEHGGPIFGRICLSLWRLSTGGSYLANLDESTQLRVDHSVMHGLSVICSSELSISDKSLQNSQLISNCLISCLSHLFSDKLPTVYSAANSIMLLIAGRANTMEYLGYPRLQMVTLELMKAIIEQLDRLEDHVSMDKVKAIWEITRLLTIILSAAPG
ncbi:hypothetical protein DL89DRAFT_20303 [Linderina pennispora]|uniref:Uncharacterized protein n=1 Tax=Linderina pennispora TaxID=61395 RepID=A0A1Y1WM51_9FUNG|nr:uncharacterized protein DL89DRAFT_20303 [Linderina pennispora]ORX74637.1 hypothetical protein DL89DRAFT_20303 [Linderina pennispora]